MRLHSLDGSLNIRTLVKKSGGQKWATEMMLGDRNGQQKLATNT
jgi:hypothetical protein